MSRGSTPKRTPMTSNPDIVADPWCSQVREFQVADLFPGCCADPSLSAAHVPLRLILRAQPSLTPLS